MTGLGKRYGLWAPFGIALLAGCTMQVDSIEPVGSTGETVKGGNSDPNLHVTPVESTFPCPSACFEVTANKNITHIFVDVDDGNDFTIYVNGTSTDELGIKLHKGESGPCNHGAREIVRDVWFPLTGNQDNATICVVVHDSSSARISVGAKAASACKESETQSIECKPKCDDCNHCDCNKCDCKACDP